MSLILVTGPTIEPVTLAEAKAQCHVDIPNDDALIAGYILDARDYVERETQRAIITQTFDFKAAPSAWSGGSESWPVYWDGSCAEYRVGILLPKPPLQSITSVSYVDTAGATQVLAADQYQVVKANGDSHEGLIVPAYGVVWPAVRTMPEAITVRFVAGYGGLESVPHGIRQAMLMMIGHWYRHREAVDANNLGEIAFAVQALLSHFRIL